MAMAHRYRTVARVAPPPPPARAGGTVSVGSYYVY